MFSSNQKLLLAALATITAGHSSEALTFTENFNNAPDFTNNWHVSANSGTTQVTYTAGNLQVYASNAPSNITFLSNLIFTGDIDVTFQFNHQGYGRTNVGLSSSDGSTSLALAALDTDDTNYLAFVAPPNSTEYEHSGSPYMNRWTTIRIQVQGTQAKFYAAVDGNTPTLLDTLAFSPSGSFRLMFNVSSQPWKSGDNTTSFRSVTANGAVAQNLIANGSFELPGFSNGSAGDGRQQYPAPSNIGGWTVGGTGDVFIHKCPDIQVVGSTYCFAQDGSYYLDLSGSGPPHATINQDFATTPGKTYQLSFYVGASNETPPAPTINVQVTGNATLLNNSVTPSSPGTNINWNLETFSFVANSSSTRLSFTDLSSTDDNASFVDNVSVTAENALPAITTQPQPTVVIAGNTATFSVIAASSTPLAYQWWLNGNSVAGATSSTLTIPNAQLAANAGNYRVVVSNSFGSTSSWDAELTVLSKLDGTVLQPPYAATPIIASGKDSLVFITHGRTPTTEDSKWINQMASLIANNVPSNWQVVTYPWVGQSSTDIFHVVSNAQTEGRKAGMDLVNLAGGTPNHGWAHVHFIAHSAGAALVEEAARILEANGVVTEVHTTLLDPYTDWTDAQRSVYGLHANWADNYFDCSSDTYDVDVQDATRVFGQYGRTDGPLAHAYNVDVTALDPTVTQMPVWCTTSSSGSTPCRYQPYSTHGWPITFYENTIGNAQYAPGYGFPLSKEAGGWNNHGNDAEGNSPVVLGGSQSLIQGPINLGPGLFVNYNNLPNAMSQTGTIQTTSSGFTAVTGGGSTSPSSRISKRAAKAKKLTRVGPTVATGSPVWISVPIDTTSNINYVQFDLTFTSSSGAAGLVTVYWNDQQVAVIDEQYILPGAQTYVFTVPGASLDKNNCLGFRLDPFSSVSSSISAANVKTGLAGLPQPPVLSIAKNQSGNQVMSLTGTQGYTFLIQASTDLLNWTPISNVSLTGDTTAHFADPDAVNFASRFYRALSP
jgi:hypothetical protein